MKRKVVSNMTQFTTFTQCQFTFTQCQFTFTQCQFTFGTKNKYDKRIKT